MNKITGKRRTACFVLLFTILLTLLFIFGNSMASQKDSEHLSDQVNETVGDFISLITGKEDSSLENFFEKYHRKVAHFVEFAALGAQIILLLHFARKIDSASLLVGGLFSFAVASFDEGLQIFTGRGDQVFDIFIDVGGYLSAYLIGLVFLYAFFWRKANKMQSEPSKG